MDPDTFGFSIPEHVLHVDGYLDAVGRSLTTDGELYALCARRVNDSADVEKILGVPIRRMSHVENWSGEFTWLVESLLGMDQRGRLAFYLIEALCWFKEFTVDARCFRLECERLRPNVIAQAAYLLELQDDHRVLLLAVRSAKSTQPE